MADDPHPSELRTSALAMIADGNGVESVASVLGVPVALVSGWMREPHFAAAAPAATSRRAPSAAERSGPASRLGIVAPLVGWLLVDAVALWQTVPYVVDSFEGSPPIGQLARYEGAVTSFQRCHTLGRNVWREHLTLAGERGAATLEIPCVLPEDALSDGKPHRARVLARDKGGSGWVVYDVQLDGRTLLAYADVKRDQDDGWSALRGMSVIWFVLLVVTAASVWTTRRSLAAALRA